MQLTSSIVFLNESLLSIVTPVSGWNSGGSVDLSDGTTAKMKISALRVNIVGLWDERFILLSLYMRLVPVVAYHRFRNQHHDKLARHVLKLSNRLDAVGWQSDGRPYVWQQIVNLPQFTW